MNNPTTSKYRDRIHLLELFAEKGFKTGCEIGVLKGEFSEKMLEIIPGLKLYLVDPYKSKKGFEAKKIAHEKLKGKNVVFIEDTSEAAVNLFRPKSLDFAYIDANHKYGYVTQDMTIWIPKIRKGGIISGHDYIEEKFGVRKAVNDYTKHHNIQFSITAEVRRKGQCASWFWQL